MKYCKKCVQPDTRYGIEFNEEGVCGGCLYEERKNKEINWEQRKAELVDIAEEAKKKAKEWGSSYDCAIGVSGGKDSTFIACYAKEELGLRVILVNSLPAELTIEGKKNLDNLKKQGFDTIHFSANPLVAKKVALASFERFGHICKAYEYTVTSSSVIIAEKFNIPLILNGENGAEIWGQTKFQKPNDDWFQVINSNTNQGCNASDWVTDEIKLDDLVMYQVPNIEKLKEKGVRGLFLQHYVREFSSVYNADFSIARGFVGRYRDRVEDIGRYRIFSSVDDDIMIVNEMLKYLKLGFGRATEDACIDIREGRLSREEAVKLVKKFDGLCAEHFIDNFCNYVSIDKNYFWSVVDRFVNKDLFEKNKAGKWIPKFIVGENF